MRYWGQFRSIQQDKLYTVEIVTDNSTVSQVEMTLGPDPFITQMDNSAETIYTPVKCSAATLQIVRNDYLTSLYSSTATQHTVKLYDASSNVVWTGFTTPNTFSAPYNFETETYEIECYDGLSALQYYDYEVVDASSGKQFVTFWQVVNKILAKVGCYNGFRFSKNTRVPDSNYCLLPDCVISEQNFFDEDDKPMKMKEVLEEICKFCNVTAVADGTFVYFLDYDAIRHDVSTYQTYQVGVFQNSQITVSQNYTLSAESYMESNSNLSLDNTYNKVTIKDSLYEVSSDLSKSMFYDDEDLTNWGNSWTYSDCWRYDNKYSIVLRLYKNKNITNYYYNNSGDLIGDSTAVGSMNRAKTLQTVGATIARCTWEKTGEKWGGGTVWSSIKSLDNSNYIMMHLNDVSDTNQLLMEATYDKPCFIGNNVYVLISGSYIAQDGNHSTADSIFPCTDDDYKDKNDKWWRLGDSCLSFGLSVNNQWLYYAGGQSGFQWRAAESKVTNIPWGSEIHPELRGDNFFFDTEHSIDNTVTWDMNLKEKGWAFRAPGFGSNERVATPLNLKFRLYGKDRVYTCATDDGIFHDYKKRSEMRRIWLKDFEIKLDTPVPETQGENETDTAYSNVINEDYVKELSDITFKVCTWDSKGSNYSCVATHDNNGGYYFIDTLTNAALNEELRAEEHLINRIVNQYKQPAVKLELTLVDSIKPWALVTNPNLNNMKMIVDNISYDFRNDSATYTLIQKY